MQDLYVNDKDFKGYVDRYSEKHGVTAEVAMTHALVRQYAEVRKNNQAGEQVKSTHTPMGECV